MSPDKLLAYHRSLLLDTVRTRAFRAAIEEVVQPGDTVLDLGTGTGVLALFALRAGARHVWAIDESGIIETARAVAAANGYADRITFVRSESFRVELPARVDVVVSEMIGNLGIEERTLETLVDARTRFLKPGGTLIPRSLEIIAAPVEAPELHERFVSWAGELYGLDLSPLRRFGANNVQRAKLEPGCLLAAPITAGRIDFTRAQALEFAGGGSATVSREGACHGLGVWFCAGLTATRTLTSEPPLETPNWHHGVLPLDPPLAVSAGDRLAMELFAGERGARWSWRVRRDGPRQALREHATDRGSLADPEAARKTRLGHRPQLAESGHLVRYALGLMDGERPLGAIADAVAERYPSHFPVRWALIDFLGRLSAKFAD